MPSAPLGVSMGDPAGIGPEIILQAWQKLRSGKTGFFAIGSKAAFDAVSSSHPITLIGTPQDALDHFETALPLLDPGVELSQAFKPGHADPASAHAVKQAIETGVKLCLEGSASALVTAPIAKSVMYEAGFDFPGHTEFLAELTREAEWSGLRGPAMMLAGGGLRVVLTSIHEPLLKAVFNLNPDHVARIARLTAQTLSSDFGIERPRLALAGLNPHAGENGALGREELDTLIPVAEALRQEGLDITDPLPPDTMFHAEARAHYDAAICHYHDQGLIPVKTLDFHGGVNITLGLPIVRTSPDHGTAFDIAGKGLARADSLIAALQTAQMIAGHRHG